MANNQKTDQDSQENSEPSRREEIARVARQRFKYASDAWSETRREALEDLKFVAGEQWPADIRAEREAEGRPCLVINRVDPLCRQLTNDQRQNRPSSKVSAVDDVADPIVAEVLEGIIRNIKNNSNADTAYDTAYDGVVKKGFGAYRIVTAFESPMSFKQEIKIKRIRNDFQVYLDPNFKEPDGSDAEWAFICENLPKDDFKAQFPDAEINQTDDWSSIGDNYEGWVKDETVQVAEYFYREYRKATIVELNDGAVFEKDDLPEVLPEGTQIVAERQTTLSSIKWCKLNGGAILEETEWLGSWIPIIPVLGKETDINGKLILSGLVRDAKDSARMYNYMASNEAEAIALAPKAPYIAAEGQIPEQYRSMWETANKKSHPFLVYTPKALNGVVMPPPQRQTYEPAIQAITQSKMQASEDMKATTGIQDAALGIQSNEQSGRAIDRRAHQSQTSNFHYVDNLNRSICHGDRQIIELIPLIYDEKQAIRIIGEDGKRQIVGINQIFKYKGKTKNLNLNLGKYDVVVQPGPNFATKRQEAVASMLDFIQAVPTAGPVLVDILAKLSDWPEAQLVSERLKKIAPPGVIEDDEQEEMPAQAKAQIQQMDQMIQQLTAKLNEASEEIKTKKMELESRERIELMKIEADIKKELFKANATASQKILEKELMDIDRREDIVGMNEPIGSDLNEPSPDQAVAQSSAPTGGSSPGQSPYGGNNEY